MKTLPLLLALSTVLLLSSCASDNTSASFAEAKSNFQQENYETAYQQILVPAEKGNPEAQYALGYMYYYGKGTQMNHVLGQNWIRKAAVAGDENAIKALQMILSQEQNIMGNPAKTTVTQEAKLPENDMSSHVNVVKSALPIPHKTSEMRPIVAVAYNKHHYTSNEQSLLKTRSNHYAIQLLDAGELHYAKSFIKRYSLGGKAKVYRRLLNGKAIYVVVYGDYATRANAETVVGKLPKPVQKLKPWIRRYSGIQADIRHTK